MATQAALLRTKRFLPLFITQLFGAFNDNAFKNAFLIWFTFDIASSYPISAEIMVTIAAGIFIAPFFLFSVTAGQIADKYEKAKLTKIIKFIEIVLMVFCILFFYIQSIYGLLISLFLMGAQSTFFGPIKYSLLPEHLNQDELIAGNGLVEGSTFLSILVGTIFGGVVIRIENGILIFSIITLFCAIAGWVASLYIPKTKVLDPNLRININIIKQAKKIIGYSKREYSVWLAIIGISWFWLIGSIFLMQFPVYTKEIIGGNEHVVTLFFTIFSLGICIGSILCNKILKGNIDGRLLPLGSLGISANIVLFYLFSMAYQKSISSLNVILNAPISLKQFFQSGIISYCITGSLLSMAIFSGIYIVPLYAIMQDRTESIYLSRVISANNVINAMFMVTASFIALLFIYLDLTALDLFLFVSIVNLFVFFFIKKIVKDRVMR